MPRLRSLVARRLCALRFIETFDDTISLQPGEPIDPKDPIELINNNHGIAPIRQIEPSNELVSYRNLIMSTGNLYLTYHDAATASVWRADQNAIPGQEILLYSEPNTRFGDIVFAQVDGIWWGYIFSTGAGGAARIKRVPLTGGAATDLASVTNVDVANSHRNLVTDGENLYWQDVNSVRKMPIRGGTITVRTRPRSP